MTKQNKQESILGQAMLVNVCLGLWTARKHDATVTDKVNTEMAKNSKAGRYHKRLFGGDAPSHSHLVQAAQAARTKHYTQTLPWEDNGWRLLPTENYFEYTKTMRQAKRNFEEALEEFLTEYPRLVRRAEERLGQMYRRDDYPTRDQVRRKFHFSIEFGPVPAGDDFRVKLPQKEMAVMVKGVEQRVAEAVKSAMGDAWGRLGDAVTDLRSRLVDGKYLRETMITRLGEVADVLGRLNLTKDAALETARKRVLKDLASLDVDALRDDDKVRKDAKLKADAILATMKGVYSPSKK